MMFKRLVFMAIFGAYSVSEKWNKSNGNLDM